MAAIILLLAVVTYWFLQHEGIDNCRDQGRAWDYARWACEPD
ncbi:MAG: hypothetical protein ABI668_11300 [Sphingorhabdus sp.]